MFHNTLWCFNHFKAVPPTRFAQIWWTLSTLCAMRCGCKRAPESGLQMCLDTRCYTRHEMVICEFFLGGEVGSCNKSKNKPSFDRELAPSSTNLAITGKSRHCLSWWNLSVLLLIQVVTSKYCRIFLRHITLSHPNIEGWLFKCITILFVLAWNKCSYICIVKGDQVGVGRV
jgi:hypothetical protein